MNLILNDLRNYKLFNNNSIEFGKMITRSAGKSPAQSQRGHRRSKIYYSLKCNPGDEVRSKVILGIQKSLTYHPGINVALNPRDKSLYSLREGTVYFSIEKFNPNPKSHFVEQFYPKMIGPVYKKYIHVLPKKDPIMFKLVDII